MTMRRHADRGSAAIEAAIIAPWLLILIGAAIVGGRIQVAGGAVEEAAHDAARAASISRTKAEASQAAYAAASATLSQEGLHCARLTVAANLAGFDVQIGQPATVSVSVTCVIDFSDLAADGLPGSKTINYTFVSALDNFRTRS
ncbi:TadE/TadG family type IV pilus assembly protein [Phytohabitans aurantiacus]|uniref:Membrane protein n=1 Tax=Phytohabitans aurantiacus TaxID=3016789 RepID=A0ABQ5QZ15_9ACTN|nr:TadE/TadG family type IV pilus assembly protein [Phytohabitans aurantiacus]GLH99793.1 membrane protein [Phytohabitans aurantiacus]